ncbi:16S rRNA (uracil(1498)-N(3))-methyltransferase [Fructilactobacillus ixorae]|uniref:Ribosomal RNA small subunit methyltransferase E n=1 Tax=Fructilactobacillus ixorae TaxID=1750535 RepID=A0ABY5C1Y2_9LACO|nr:16S rRNA (uracil(1498)-N(3))-methyltransferase [Fructilactobacillus ixorae]USS92781.1 16S rRNA (uracil(1498)-N(3))-methyltransferase [Fructilactobacillus ixorae]
MQHYFSERPLTVGEEVPLSAEIKQHWLRVLRATIGTQAEFVDDQQQVFVGELVDEQQGIIKIVAATTQNVELPVAVTIACGLPKSGKAELIVQKATELGAQTIIFVPTDWSVAKWSQKATKKIARLQKIARSAAEQSHRNVIPEVRYYENLTALQTVAADADQRVIAYEEAAKQGETSRLVQLGTQLHPGDRVIALFGPEGGLRLEEVQDLQATGFQVVGLGPRILRTESAPLYFLSAISVLSELK